MAKNVTLLGADYPDVPAVDLPQTGGGTAVFFERGEIETALGTARIEKTETGGPVISFEDGADGEPMTLQFNVTPVQSGSGDPSPSNVRPITGWTGANISVSPTQDAQDATVYPITFPDSAGTVYGGALSVNADGTGTLVVDKAYKDLGDIIGSKNSEKPSVFLTGNTLDPAPKTGLYNVLCTEFGCDVSFSFRLANADNVADNKIYRNANSALIYLKCSSLSDKTISQAKEALNGIKVVYEVANPITYTLTPGQVFSLLGQNNIWADTGDMTAVTYFADLETILNNIIS